MAMAVLRDLSIILLALVTILVGAIPLALTGALVYGFGRLLRHDKLPSWLGLASAYVALARAYVDFATAAVARPIIAVNSALAKVEGWWRGAGTFWKGEHR